MSLDIYFSKTNPKCACCGRGGDSEELFSSNITHNLGRMAREAGIYDCLWRPDEHAITHARQMIDPLRAGIALLKSEPDRFKHLSTPNGWGTYEQFVPWVEKVLVACEAYPEGEVTVSR